MPHEVQGNTVPHRKGLRYGKYESRGLSCGCTSSISQYVMKSDKALHIRSFVDSLLQTTVCDHRPNMLKTHCFFTSSMASIVFNSPN